MSDPDVLTRVQSTDPVPTGSPLPSDAITPELALQRIERRMGMRTEEIERGKTPLRSRTERPGRRWLAVAALGAIVATGSLVIWITASSDPGDVAFTDTSQDLSALVRAEALDGEPTAVAKAWFWAFWSGDEGLLVDLSDPAITGPGFNGDHIDDMLSYSTFERLIQGGRHAFEVGRCDHNEAVSEYQCWVASNGEHAFYGWQAGAEFMIRLKIVDERIQRYSFEFGREPLMTLYASALEADMEGFSANCAAGNVITEPIDANNHLEALSPRCAVFMRDALGEG